MKTRPALLAGGAAVAALAAGLYWWQSGTEARHWQKQLDAADPAVRTQAVEELTRLDARAAAPLVAAKVRDADAGVAARAVLALGQAGRAADVPALQGALRDERAEVREAAAAALGRAGDDGQQAPLLAALHDDPDPRVRAAAAVALGRLFLAPEAITAVVAAMRDPDLLVRTQAAAAVRQILGLNFAFDPAGAEAGREPMIREIEAFWPSRYQNRYAEYHRRLRGGSTTAPSRNGAPGP